MNKPCINRRGNDSNNNKYNFLTNNKSPTTGCIITLTLFSSKFEVLLFLKISIRKLGPNKKKKGKLKTRVYDTKLQQKIKHTHTVSLNQQTEP